MKSEYIPPEFGSDGFHCPRCGVYANQLWHDLQYVDVSWLPTHMSVALCVRCNDLSYWFKDRLIDPPVAPVEPAHIDLPDDCRSHYEEAMGVFGSSPRSAAALLRLCIQKLMPHMGEKGKDLNHDIGSLVRKGLPVLVQKALDVTRVVGNNAVHPGEIDINDSPEIAQHLFRMINYIVEDRITRPREIKELYESLPDGAKDGVERRDAIADEPDVEPGDVD